PKVLFLDEPTTGLDPQNRANLWRHIKKLRDNGISIFLSTHYLEEADALSMILVILDQCKIVAEETPSELKDKISFKAIYLELQYLQDVEKINVFFNQIEIYNVIETDMKFTIYTSKGEELIGRIFKYSKENHVELVNLSLSMPSLNDVFLSLTGKELRDGGKRGEQ